MLYLIKCKSLPILLDICAATIAEKRSLDFMQTRLLMKIFKTGSVNIFDECRVIFGVENDTYVISRGKQRFCGNF